MMQQRENSNTYPQFHHEVMLTTFLAVLEVSCVDISAMKRHLALSVFVT